MDKPFSFAGKVVKKYGKSVSNDFPQPDKFFNDMRDFYKILNDIPFSAVEELDKYDENKQLMISVLRRMFKVCDAAKIDIINEMQNMDISPFDGLEDDLVLRNRTIEN